MKSSHIVSEIVNFAEGQRIPPAKRSKSAGRHTGVFVSAVAGSVFSLSAAASGLDLGNASGYAIVSAGAGSSLTINSGPITGNLLVGDGASVSTSGGGNGRIIGTINDDGSVPQSAFSGLATAPTAGDFASVTSSYVVSAVNSAASVSTYAQGLAATQTYVGTISAATTFIGDGGLNVIDVNNIQNAPLTFSGGANDFFVVNVAGTYNTNVAMALLGGVSGSDVLFNFLGTSGNVFQTSGGDLSFGTYLSTRGGNFQFSNLLLSGSLINTAGHIQFVSGSSMTVVPVTVTPVPEPKAYALMLAGLATLVSVSRRRNNERS